jgi:hypothetical protein
VHDPGTLCRSKDAIIKCDDDRSGRICRVVSVVPEHRWRSEDNPEYKVELLAMPVTAFRRHDELDVVSFGTVLPPQSEAGEVRA